MISCEEATAICNKKQYNEATTWQKITLRFHVLMCKACSKFTKKNTQLTSLFEKANLQSLSENDKKKLREQLEKKF
ncbi:hypothetical protein U1E44_07465 [Arenibacter sp. GZD96]|uniref:hypothetical protein n=1 Tax=Aurantibrevibacter litoralis TaxID=3106030 RepID=UPI002AFE691A|nr:hypothetical protein [Arenibacter sp. GZD-96]MEA1785925.1 hypothetical protein [Arenibacter sp. GZD-96]